MGEIARKEGGPPRGAIHVVRSLGLVGLYTGVTSCLARDGKSVPATLCNAQLIIL